MGFDIDGKILGFVFDMDGVLLDSESVYEEAWRVVAKEMGLKDIDLVHRKCLGRSEEDVHQIMKMAYGETFDSNFFWNRTSDWSMDFMNEKGVPVKIGTFEFLDFLISRNIRMSVATSSSESFAGKLLKRAGLLKYFETVVYGNEVQHSKPHPEIYSCACRKLGLEPFECVAVEDSPNGIKSADAAGLKCAMIPDRIMADEEMKNMSWKIFESFVEMKSFFESRGR